jgi:uncharacterized membrane protein
MKVQTITSRIRRTKLLNKTEDNIAFILRYGVNLCSGVLLLGLILRLNPAYTEPGYDSLKLVQELTQGKISSAHSIPGSVSDFVHGIVQVNPDSIISLGLWMLILLPVLRVLLTVTLFIMEKDWIYLGITSLVLVILIFSLRPR